MQTAELYAIRIYEDCNLSRWSLPERRQNSKERENKTQDRCRVSVFLRYHELFL